MKLTVERGALLRSLAHIQSVVERRNTIPILSNVQLVAEQDVLHLTATDLDLAIAETVPCAVTNRGSTTAPAHTLYDIARKLPEGSQVELDYEGDDGRLVVRSGNAKFSLACLPREDFPVMAEGDLPLGFRLPAPELRKVLDKTRFAISTEETRYYLNGIYLHVIEESGSKKLRGVATDGHRLARVEIPFPKESEGIPGVIIPRKAVIELSKLIEDKDVSVEIGLSETRARFTFENIVFNSKLIDGTFPDYERVIPSENDKHMEVDREIFARAVDRVATISSEKSRAVKLSIDGDSVVLTANSPDQGSGTDEVKIAYDGGALLEIGFNARYLLDITQQIEGESARFDLSDGTSPTIVRDLADDTALYVLMPMRV